MICRLCGPGHSGLRAPLPHTLSPSPFLVLAWRPVSHNPGSARASVGAGRKEPVCFPWLPSGLSPPRQILLFMESPPQPSWEGFVLGFLKAFRMNQNVFHSQSMVSSSISCFHLPL